MFETFEMFWNDSEIAVLCENGENAMSIPLVSRRVQVLKRISKLRLTKKKTKQKSFQQKHCIALTRV